MLKESPMPRYLIERSFPDGLSIPMNAEGRKAMGTVVATNAEHGVTWVHSYVSPDRKSTFCIYDAPAPEAIRKVADRNGLPVTRITEVSVLDPYFYQP
jgi:predicted amidohydrolase YtcJ